MTDDYQPGPAADARVRQDAGRWTLVFVRYLRHPPETVWAALTDPDQLREWSPFDADRDLGSTGAATLTSVGTANDEAFASEVRHADAPRVLEYTWADGVVRWELEAADSGTRLTLLHTIGDPEWLPKLAAGWHLCIDLAARAIAGNPFGRILAADTRRFGWERLNSEYAAMFGIEDTGWPAELMGEE